MDTLRAQVRTAAGREPTPSATVIDLGQPLTAGSPAVKVGEHAKDVRFIPVPTSR